jgi:hypothetical protein
MIEYLKITDLVPIDRIGIVVSPEANESRQLKRHLVALNKLVAMLENLASSERGEGGAHSASSPEALDLQRYRGEYKLPWAVNA